MKSYQIALLVMLSVIQYNACAEASDHSLAAVQHLEQASTAARSGMAENALQEAEQAKKHVIAHEFKHPFHQSADNPKEMARWKHAKQALTKIDEAKSSAKQGRIDNVVTATGEAEQHIREEVSSDKAPN